MALAMLAAPVMAKPPETPKKIPVTFVRSGGHPISRGWNWTTPGGVFHQRDGVHGITNHALEGVEEDLSEYELYGHSDSTYMTDINLKTMKGSQKYKITLGYQQGTFEGVYICKGTFFLVEEGVYRIYTGVIHAVWHGTGAYLGWTLTVDTELEEGTPKPQVYLLIP